MVLSIYIRKWRLPDAGEQMTGPLFCEVAIARQTPIEAGTVDKIMDEIGWRPPRCSNMALFQSRP